MSRPIIQRLRKKELSIVSVHTMSSLKPEFVPVFQPRNEKVTESYRISYDIALAGKAHPIAKRLIKVLSSRHCRMPTGWKISKIQGRATSCVTMTRRIKDLATDMMTEFISCLWTCAFALQMSRFTDVAQPVSTPATPPRIFFYVNAQQWTQVCKGWITLLTLMVHPRTTSFPFARLVQKQWQRKLLAS